MSSSSETIIPSKESSKMTDNQPSFMNLPPDIILDILSRLPIRTIVSCKCVCRQFLELITSADFAEFHLPRSTPGLIIQHSTSDYIWKIFEFEDDVEVQPHYLHYKHLMEFDTEAALPYDPIWMVGSVNGLLCLAAMINNFKAFYICNPITHEYIALPEPEELLDRFMLGLYGFGVSSSSGEYKLVRISHDPVVSPTGRDPDLKCLIYTLGRGSWRRITSLGGITFNLYAHPAHEGHGFLRGSLHWLVGGAERSIIIACFNLDTELFHSFPLTFPFSGCGSLAILRDYLCVCDCHPGEDIVIWMMKDYGVGESWTKEYVISRDIGVLDWRVSEVFWPLKVFKDGDILFVWQDEGLWKNEGLLYYSSKTKTTAEAGLFEGIGYSVTVPLAMLHTPSLLSLKGFEKENVASFGY